MLSEAIGDEQRSCDDSCSIFEDDEQGFCVCGRASAESGSSASIRRLNVSQNWEDGFLVCVMSREDQWIRFLAKRLSIVEDFIYV